MLCQDEFTTMGRASDALQEIFTRPFRAPRPRQFSPLLARAGFRPFREELRAIRALARMPGDARDLHPAEILDAFRYPGAESALVRLARRASLVSRPGHAIDCAYLVARTLDCRRERGDFLAHVIFRVCDERRGAFWRFIRWIHSLPCDPLRGLDEELELALSREKEQ